MKKNSMPLVFLLIMLCACNSNTPSSISSPQSGVSPSLPSEESMTNSADNVAIPTVLTKQDIHDFELLRSDWTKEQMEEVGLEKTENDLAGETYYSNDDIKYVYLDYFVEVTPAVVEVYKEYPGPRGIRVGDTFDDVMMLFPQDKDWKSNAHGVFYGQFEPDTEQDTWGLSGYVSSYDIGRKEITLLSENVYPWMRIFFQEDVVTHYSIYLIGKD